MKKIKLIILGVAAVLSIVNYALTPLYIGVLMLLGHQAYLAFVPLAGLLALVLVYFQGDADKTLEDLIARKIKREKIKKIFLKIFKARIAAIVFSILFLGPYLTPLVVNLCVKGEKKVYFWAAVLNMLGVALWIFIYLGGRQMIKLFLMRIS